MTEKKINEITDLTTVIKNEEVATLITEANKLEVPTISQLEELYEKNKDLKAIEYTKEEKEKIAEGRKELKNARLKVSKLSKLFKDFLNGTKNKVIGSTDDVLSIIEPLEKELQDEENKIQEKWDKEKEEEQRKIQQKLDDRLELLRKYGVEKSSFDVQLMSDEEFEKEVNEAKVKWEEEEQIRKEELLINRKKTIDLKIIDCNNLEELEKVRELIDYEGFDFVEFEATFVNKQKMLKFEEEKAELEEQKTKEAAIKATKKELLECDNLWDLKRIRAEYESNHFEFEEIKYEYELRLELLELRKKEADEEAEKKRKEELDKARKEEAEKAKRVEFKTKQKVEQLEKATTIEELENIYRENQDDLEFNFEWLNKVYMDIKNKLYQEQKQKEEDERINEEKKYIAFLKKCGITKENKHEFHIKKNEETGYREVYKLVDVYKV